MHVFRGLRVQPKPDAPQGLDRRMTHLAATFADNPHPRVAANLRPAPDVPRPHVRGLSCLGLWRIYYLQST